MSSVPGGVLFARLVAGGVAGAVAAAGAVVGLAAPAHAVPVTVTTTLTDAAGNVLDGYVSIDQLQPDGTYAFVPGKQIADGVVSLSLEPGTYKLAFEDEDNLFVREYYNDKATFETADPVVVTGATALAPVVLAAAPSMSGQVVAPTGKPIKDASVGVYREGDTFAFRTTRTDANGGFALGLAAGTYRLEFSADGYAPEFYNNKADLVSADPIALGQAGANVGQVVLGEGSVVTGRVTAPGGVPLERARVSVETESGNRSYSDLTDASGAYRVEGIAAGTYKVRFSDPVGEYAEEWHAGKTDKATADPVAIGVDQVVPLDAELALDPDRRVFDPATADVVGKVVDSSGAPVIGADIAVFDTPADGDEPKSRTFGVRTDRAGTFFLDELKNSTEDQWRIFAQDTLGREDNQYTRIARWYGGTQNYGKAANVPTKMTGVDITLPLTGGISGTITSEAGLPVEDVNVVFFDERGNPAASYNSFGTRGTRYEKDGTYADLDLVPGQYKVQFVDLGGDSIGIEPSHAPEWFDGTTFARAKVVKVASGATTGNVNASMSAELKALRKPEIRGKQFLGGTLRAYSGVWSVESGTTYVHEWLIDGAVVGTGATFKVPSSARNDRITLRTTAENLGLTGTTLVSTQKIRKEAKVKVAVKGSKATVQVKAKVKKLKKFAGKVLVEKLVRTDDYGAPVYKKIATGKLKNGRASLALKKLTKGKNKLLFTITFKGSTYGASEITKTVKVTRKG